MRREGGKGKRKRRAEIKSENKKNLIYFTLKTISSSEKAVY